MSPFRALILLVVCVSYNLKESFAIHVLPLVMFYPFSVGSPVNGDISSCIPLYMGIWCQILRLSLLMCATETAPTFIKIVSQHVFSCLRHS